MHHHVSGAGIAVVAAGGLLHDDPSAVRESAGCLALLLQEVQELVEGAVGDRVGGGVRAPIGGVGVRAAAGRREERPHRVAEGGAVQAVGIGPGQILIKAGQDVEEAARPVVVAVERLAAPEGEGPGGVGDGLDPDAAVGDPADLPLLVAEDEDLAQAALPDELLVELAEFALASGEAELVVAPVGDGAAGVVDHALHAGAAADGAGQIVLEDPRLEIANV